MPPYPFQKEGLRPLTPVKRKLKRLLAELDRIICNSDDLQGIEMGLKNYDNLKRELEGIYDRRGCAAMFPSKCRWIEQGEKPTKYFFNLERKNYTKKVISKLETENGTPITGKDQILAEIEHYYQSLYAYI